MRPILFVGPIDYAAIYTIMVYVVLSWMHTSTVVTHKFACGQYWQLTMPTAVFSDTSIDQWKPNGIIISHPPPKTRAAKCLHRSCCNSLFANFPLLQVRVDKHAALGYHMSPLRTALWERTYFETIDERGKLTGPIAHDNESRQYWSQDASSYNRPTPAWTTFFAYMMHVKWELIAK